MKLKKGKNSNQLSIQQKLLILSARINATNLVHKILSRFSFVNILRLSNYELNTRKMTANKPSSALHRISRGETGKTKCLSTGNNLLVTGFPKYMEINNI